jgi:hypothetical protein
MLGAGLQKLGQLKLCLRAVVFRRLLLGPWIDMRRLGLNSLSRFEQMAIPAYRAA